MTDTPAKDSAPNSKKEEPPAPPKAAPAKPAGTRKVVVWSIVGVVLILALIFGLPRAIESFNTVSTEDAYINGHVTFVAPRVGGQVVKVYVDDNNRVKKGDLLLQLDKTPYDVEVAMAQAAVKTAEGEILTATAQTRGLAGQMRALRYMLEHAMEDVRNQVALLHAKVAALGSRKATLNKTQADYDRALPLLKSGTVSQDEFDKRKEALKVAQADVEAALQAVYQVRVSLGLPPEPAGGSEVSVEDLAKVPDDIEQSVSEVRQAQASLMQVAAQLGVYPSSLIQSPKDMIAEFYRRDPEGNLERIYAKILENAPSLSLANAKLEQAKRNLEQAQLNRSYCDVYAEIDGVVSRRSVNPGNNLIAGQAVMTVRSLTEIWVDANFKETQLASLRIGQSVDLDVDMYGSKEHFRGRISGFTMGTGSTLSLLPAENATGNFVKVVQRLPVRIDILDYDPDKAPLFVGLSVTPVVRIHDPVTGPDAGKVLQPYAARVETPASAPADPVQEKRPRVPPTKQGSNP